MTTKKLDKKQLKVLLLQIREDANVKEEEHKSFALHSGLEISQIAVHNTFDEPLFGPEILEGYDALFVGGASEASVLQPEKYSFIQPSIDLLKYTAENSIPTFASCFGFQVAVLAFGGEIIRDEEVFEMGTCPISLTEEAL